MSDEEDAQTAALQEYYDSNRPAGYGASFRAGWDAGRDWLSKQAQPATDDDVRAAATRLRDALERILRDTRTFIVAADSPAEAVPFYEIGSIARAALSAPGEPENDVDPEPRPILELLGALPDLTGGLTAVEYVRRVRDGTPETPGEPESGGG